jgi:hypothetical protein
MKTPTLSLKHVPIDDNERCGGCGAGFIASEDSGSRVFTITDPEGASFSALLCGGCHSKWSHGMALTIRSGRPV